MAALTGCGYSASARSVTVAEPVSRRSGRLEPWSDAVAEAARRGRVRRGPVEDICLAQDRVIGTPARRNIGHRLSAILESDRLPGTVCTT
jgi:hypothetical protein